MTGHCRGLLPPLLGFLAVWWLMPRAKAWPRAVGVLLGLAALVSGALTLFQPSGAIVYDVLFGLFALVAIVSAVAMITNRNPLYSGVVVRRGDAVRLRPVPAAFRAVPGRGHGDRVRRGDHRDVSVPDHAGPAGGGRGRLRPAARQPLAATLLGFVVLGGLLCALRPWTPVAVASDAATGPAEAAAAARQPGAGARAAALAADPLSQRGDRPWAKCADWGRVLFGNYLYAVELAGTLLLVASVGAIAIALRSRRGAT